MAGETQDTSAWRAPPGAVYRTDAQFVAEVTATRADLETAKKTLRDTLVTRGALTAEEAKKCDTSVEVVVDDQRAEKDKLLPEVPAAK